MPRIRIISAPKLNSYQTGGEKCPEGYMWNEFAQQCVPDPNLNNFDQNTFDDQQNQNISGVGETTPDVINPISTPTNPYNFQPGQQGINTGIPSSVVPSDPAAYAKYKKPSFFSKAQKFNKKYMSPFAKGVGAAIAIGTPYKNFFEQRAQQKAFNSRFRNANFTRADVSPGDQFGNFDINQGIFKSRQKTPWNEGAFTNQFDSPLTAQFGGSLIKDTDMEKMKVRITGLPSKKYGGQSEYGLDKGWRIGYTEMPEHKREGVSKSLEAVPRSEANIEAEKGETVYGDMDNDGVMEHFNIGGKRHVDGGTPLKVPEGSFIFSDTKKMMIKDPKVLSEFGVSAKGGITPADIAKKYDINKYKAIMEDPNTDPLMKETAQMMVKNYEKKLAKLAFIQEKTKGFPQGIPEICRKLLSPEFIAQAEEYIAKQKGQQPSSLQQLGSQGAPPQQQAPQQAPPQEEMPQQGAPEPNGMQEYPQGQEPMEGMPEEQMSYEEEMPEEAYGGSIFDDGGEAFLRDYLDNEYQDGGSTPDDENNIAPWGGDKFENRKNASKYSKEEWAAKLRKAGYTGPLTNEAVQKWLYEQEKSKAVIDKLHQEYGMPKAGMFDKILGYRWDAALEGLDEVPPETTPGTFVGYKCINNTVQPSSYPTMEALTADGADANLQTVQAKCGKTPFTPPGKTPPPGRKPDVPLKWMTPDKLNLAATLAVPPKKYLPWFANVAFEPSQLALEDWRGPAAAAFSAGYAAPAATFSQFASTQGSKAGLSNLAGKNAESIAAIASGVTGKNVDRVNAFSNQERQRKDQFNLLRAERANKEYLGNVVANQQYDNSMRKYINNFAKAYGQGWKNKMQLGMLNAVNPMYNVDPRSGNSYFMQGYDPTKFGTTAGSTGTNGYSMENFAALKKYYMDNSIFTDPDKAAAEALKDIRSSKSTAATNPAMTMPALYGAMLNGYSGASDDD